MVRFVVKLLCPPVPPNYSGSKSHLVDYMSMLSAILYRASSIDTVHILSLHGMVRIIILLFGSILWKFVDFWHVNFIYN